MPTTAPVPMVLTSNGRCYVPAAEPTTADGGNGAAEPKKKGAGRGGFLPAVALCRHLCCGCEANKERAPFPPDDTSPPPPQPQAVVPPSPHFCSLPSSTCSSAVPSPSRSPSPCGSRRSSGRRHPRLRRGAIISQSRAYCKLLKENTTFHGIRDFARTRGWLRFSWVVILVLASLAALVGCVLIVWEFNTRPLVVTYSIKEDANLTLPDIVVCPFNRFNRTFLRHWNVSDQLAQYLELAFPTPAQHPFQYKLYAEMLDHRLMDSLETELDALLARMGPSSAPVPFTEFIRLSAISCEAFFANPETCRSATSMMTSAGKCFRIAGAVQRSDGFGHGQHIVVRLPKQLYHPGVNQMLNDGVVVKLAESGKGIDHDMSFVPSGVHAIFPLTATRYEFKHYPPHFNCREQDDADYSRVWCFEVCFTARAERVCNCSLATSSKAVMPNICTTRQFFRCFYPVLYDQNYEQRVATCKSQCGPPCKYWRFDKTVTYSHFPSEQARHFVNDPAKWEELQNTIILDVYYITLDYTVIRHMLSMTPPSFVAQLGGQISLWVGGSIISLIQLIIYLSSALLAHLRRKRVEGQLGVGMGGRGGPAEPEALETGASRRRRSDGHRQQGRKGGTAEERGATTERTERRHRSTTAGHTRAETEEGNNDNNNGGGGGDGEESVRCVSAKV